MTSFICRTVNDINQLTYKTETHRCRIRTYGCQGKVRVKRSGKVMHNIATFIIDKQQGPII